MKVLAKKVMNCTRLILIEKNSFIKLKYYIVIIWIITSIKVMFAFNTNLDLKTEYKTYPEQQVIMGSSASLECDIIPISTSPGDSVTLILWYKGEDISGSPIYSIDARTRNTPLESAKHFICEEFEGRAIFDITVRPSVLKISPIVETDGGQYWCRVDYRWTRTTISKVPLIVIVPPKRVIIRNQSGSELKSIALFDEGSDVRLFCESIGGNPLPTITWFRNNRKLKTQTLMIKDNNTVVSSITLESVEREDINSVLSCNAINSDLNKVVVKSVTIDLNLRPLRTHIIGINRDRLIAGRRIEAICHTFGSRPPALVNWFINDKILTDIKEIHSESNGTKSMVTFIPMPEDNGSRLICRSHNPKLSNSEVQDHITLDIKFMPNVTLRVGSFTQLVTVYESNEVLLECNVSSNPKPTHIRWLFNRKELIQDVTQGIIITNSSLIVKNVRQESEGRYQCVAYNSEGRGDSTELFVQVFYAPKCVSQQRVIETSLSYPTNIFCEVKANPENVTFVWESANIEDRRRISVSSKSLRSKLSLIPQTWTDLGLYTCWAQNKVGSNQLNPCVFNVTDSGQSVPKPVTDCKVNSTYFSFYIKCLYTHRSNTQRFETDSDFHLEVRDSQNKRLIVNLTNSVEPVFNITNIEWAPIYQLIVYVSNAFGVSNEVTMMVQTEVPALKSSVRAPPTPSNSEHQQTNDLNSSHKILVILISLLTIVLIILSILITITIVLCFLRQQNNRKRNKRVSETTERQDNSRSTHSQQSTVNKKKYKNKKLSQTNTKTSDDSIATSEGSAHPDVIPCDGVLYYNNDRNIIDDESRNNRFNANNSLSIYRDIIISGVANDQHNMANMGNIGSIGSIANISNISNDRTIANKNLLTNHTNHVSVINDRQNADNGQDIVLVQTHHNQTFDTFLVTKFPCIQSDVEATESYRHLNSTFPQTTPV